MQIAVDSISPAETYKILTSLIVPRPIAWITSRDERGTINLAPFSFFNAVGNNPPLVIVSVGNNALGDPKDTARNILESGEFVVNLVTEDLIEAMNISAADFPRGESELSATGLMTTASMKVATPRLADAKASLETTLHSVQTIGANHLILGRVVAFHVDDEFVADRAKLHIENFAPLGRLGSPSMYCRTSDRFDLKRLTYRDVKSD